MKVYWTTSNIIIENDTGDRLYYSKESRRLEVSEYGRDVIPIDVVECGDVCSVLGKLEIDDIDYLFLVTHVTMVAEFCAPQGNQPIYRIDRVKAIPTGLDAAAISVILDTPIAGSSTNKLKQGTGKLLKFVHEKMGNTPTLLDEILRLFNDYPDFFFCFQRDLTLCTQRYFSKDRISDERFFWNGFLLKDLMAKDVNKEMADRWLIPVVQGCVTRGIVPLMEDVPAPLNLTLISRRSIHRAGARYLRRGIDSESNVANFVETELLLNIFDHHLSYVQIRGSIPVFWSQKGFKYRPPFSIDRPLEESMPYFEQHMSSVSADYGVPIVLVNLVDLTGRELKLAQSYMEHSLKYDNPDITFVSFDLHHHCRGLKFDKVHDLVSSMTDLLGTIGYCWVDKTGEVVKKQQGVVRTNCVDCLDRTNVVQGAISQYVCMQQAQRLGIFGPLCEPPASLVSILQTMWADNGDTISTQYAGTAALKGDVTRCGERKLTGIMKDGYNSASRYYLSHVRDSARQKAMNALLGLPDQGSESMAASDSDSEEDENVGRLVSETVHFLLPEGEVVVGGWGLIDSQESGDAVDSVVLLTRSTLYVAIYDDDSEKLLHVRIVPLHDIEAIQVGRVSRSSRLHVSVTCSQGTWAWRPARTRLFNNVAIRLKSGEEADEYAESIAEQMVVTIEMATGRELLIGHPSRLAVGGHGGTARKALTSVTSVFKMRAKKDQNTVVKATQEPETPTAEEPPLIYLDDGMSEGTMTDDVQNSKADGSQFRDDMNPSTGELHPPQVRSSHSDGRLVERASGLVGRLKGLRTTFHHKTGGDVSPAPITDPFAKLQPQMQNTKCKLLLL